MTVTVPRLHRSEDKQMMALICECRWSPIRVDHGVLGSFPGTGLQRRLSGALKALGPA